jgi:thioredoxin reductase
MRVAKPGIAAPAQDTTITFDGREIPARAGESVAAALVAAGEYALRETAAGGRRGVFCGMGVCGECAVTINGEQRLACMEKLTPGMSAGRNPARRSLCGEFAYSGAAGGAAGGSAGEEVIETEVLVVGGGPAGLRAGLAARRAGAEVLIVDERAGAGGQYFKQPAGVEVEEQAIDAQYRAGRELLGDVEASGARVLSGARVWGAAGPEEIYAFSAGRRFVLRSRALVLATGAYEKGVPFPGWTLPGVMTTGAAQTLLRSYLVAAGSRVLVAGNGPLNLQVAAELAEAGVTVVAVAEAASLWRPASAWHTASLAAVSPGYLREGMGYLRALARARVPVLSRATVIEVRGAGRAEQAVVARLDPAGRALAGRTRTFAIDAVCVGPGFLPSSELARLLGCAYDRDQHTGAFVIERDQAGQTSVPGIWMAGDGGQIGGAQVAQAMGTLAGLDAAVSAGHGLSAAMRGERDRAVRKLVRQQRFQRALWRLYAAPRLTVEFATDNTIICRCEEVTLGELTAATRPWLAAAGPLKRVTRAGMGKCQGRYCSALLTELAGRASGLPAGPRSGFAPQVPFLPTPVNVLADGEPGVTLR